MERKTVQINFENIEMKVLVDGCPCRDVSWLLGYLELEPRKEVWTKNVDFRIIYVA